MPIIMIHENTKKEIPEALKARDAIRLRGARALVTAFTNESVTLGKTPQDILDDEQALTVIRRLAKQRKESIVQFREGEREDLVSIEEEDLAYLEKFLPQMMSKEEILKVAEAKKKTMGIEDKSQLGKFIGAIMAELKGKADGKDVKEVAESLL